MIKGMYNFQTLNSNRNQLWLSTDSRKIKTYRQDTHQLQARSCPGEKMECVKVQLKLCL